MKSQVCVDANLALKLVIAEADSLKAQRLWEEWIETSTEIVAPTLFAYEGTSVICNKMHRGLIPPDEAELMFKTFHLLGVRRLHPDGLHEKSWELAIQFNRPQAYDSHYIALAELLGINFWTADEHLYNSVKRELAYVKWLGDYSPV